MNFVFAMKMLGDLCFYFTFANFFTYLFGGHNALIAIPIITLSTFLCALFKNKVFLKYLPLTFMALCFFVIPVNLADIILLLPPILYIIYNVYNIKNFNYNLQYVDIFFLYLKVATPFIVLFLIYLYENVEKNSLPYAFIFLVNSVVLMRILRQGKDFFNETRLKVITILPIILTLLAGLILSSKTLFDTCKSVLGFIYLNVIFPILMIIVTGVSYLMNPLFNLLSKLYKSEPLIDQQSDDVLGPYENYPNEFVGQGYKILIIVIIFLFVSLLIFYILKMLKRISKNRRYSLTKGVIEERVFIDRIEKSSKRNKKLNKIRVIYKDFLIFCHKLGIPSRKSMTSSDYERLSMDELKRPEIKDFHIIYKDVRYGEKAIENKDVKQFKKIFSSLKNKKS